MISSVTSPLDASTFMYFHTDFLLTLNLNLSQSFSMCQRMYKDQAVTLTLVRWPSPAAHVVPVPACLTAAPAWGSARRMTARDVWTNSKRTAATAGLFSSAMPYVPAATPVRIVSFKRVSMCAWVFSAPRTGVWGWRLSSASHVADSYASTPGK